MASPVILQATTLEGQFAELLHILLDREQNNQTNPKGERNLSAQWQVTGEKFILQGSFLIRTVGTINEQGQLTLIADEYLLDIESQGE